MTRERSLLITPSELGEIPAAVSQLCSDLQVGGIVISNNLATQLIDNHFQQLAEGIPLKNAEVRKISNPVSFDDDVIWHLARQRQFIPALRFWHHHKGSIHFVVARALPEWQNQGYYYNDDEVLRRCYAAPIVFDPKPGEALIFVDQGLLSVTGTSSFHKTETMGKRRKSRLSTANDISFESSH
jgi:hypothetical protein